MLVASPIVGAKIVTDTFCGVVSVIVSVSPIVGATVAAATFGTVGVMPAAIVGLIDTPDTFEGVDWLNPKAIVDASVAAATSDGVLSVIVSEVAIVGEIVDIVTLGIMGGVILLDVA